MYKVYVGGFDCNEDYVAEWINKDVEPQEIFESAKEAFDYCCDTIMYDDTGWIEHNGKIVDFSYFLYRENELETF